MIALLFISSASVYSQYVEDALRYGLPNGLITPRVAGLNVAYHGVADDMGALFYNPAGMILVKSNELSMGLNFQVNSVESMYKNNLDEFSSNNEGITNVGLISSFDRQGGKKSAIGIAYYKESDFYSPGSELKMTDVLGYSIGHSICYDLRYPKMYRALAKKGAQIIVIPSAFTYTTGKAHWHSLIKARAIENGVFILAPNQWGINNENRSTYGHTLIVDPWGEILAEADDAEMIVTAELNLNKVQDCQNAIPVLDNDRNFD